MKLYKAIIHTGGKNREQIINMYGDNKYTEEELDLTKRYYDQCDGLLGIVAESAFDDGGYSLCGAAEEAGVAKFKEAVWLMEQDPMFGGYINQREQFDADWATDEYFPNASMHFKPDEVEIIELLCGGEQK